MGIFICIGSLVTFILQIMIANAAFKQIKTTGNYSKIRSLSMDFIDNSVLIVSTNKSFNTNSVYECMGKCMLEPKSYSLNYLKQSSSTEANCFVLQENLYEHGPLQDNVQYKHIYVKSKACDKHPCLNGGTCVPEYENSNFSCVCAKWFKGTFCETVKVPLPKWNFTFENDLFKSGKAYQIGLTLDKGKTIYVPDRLGKVLYCNGENCVNTQTNKNFLNISAMEISGITITMWVKLKYNGLKFINTDTSYLEDTIIISDKDSQGIRLGYSLLKNAWFVEVYASQFKYRKSYPFDYKNTQEWNHIGLTFKSSFLNLYVNGEKSDSPSKTSQERNPGNMKDWTFFQSYQRLSDGIMRINDIFYVDDFYGWFKALKHMSIAAIYKQNK